MVGLLRISWRNVWRSRRRTLISMSAVGFGLFVLLFGLALLDTLVGSAQNDLGPTGRGHVEITAKEFRLKGEVDRFLAEPDQIVAGLRQQAPEGARVGWRVVSRSLLNSPWGSRGVTVYGVQPEQEAQLSDFFTSVRDGEVLQAGDDRGVVIGAKLAQKLRLEVGDKLTLMAQGADAEVTTDLFRVRGVFTSISPHASANTVFVTATAAQRMLGLGPVAHEIVVQLPKASLAEPLTLRLRQELGEQAEVLSLAELNPGLGAMDEIIDTFMLFIAFVIFFLVGLGILNTMLMSVMERTREWGVMLALGTRPRRLVAMVAGEALWIASLSVVLGFALGLLVIWSAAELGWMDFSAAGEGLDFMGTAVDMRLRPTLPMATALELSALVWTMTLAFGLYPAWRASRLRPADALRAR
ncbi:MAG: FtsX-like permease family protein [Pseudomonadota bacterium]